MLVAAGFSNGEIAQRMDVATCTVRKHLEHAYRKLGRHQSTRGRGRAARRDAPALGPARQALGTRLRPPAVADRREKDSRKREWPHQGDGPYQGGRKYLTSSLGGTMHLVRRSCAVLVHGGPHDRAPRRGPVRCHCCPSRCAARSRLRAGGEGDPCPDGVHLAAHRAPHGVHRRGHPRSRPGFPSLGFTSLAMHRAVQSSLRRDVSSERAAVVEAALPRAAALLPGPGRPARGRPGGEPGLRGPGTGQERQA